jgi:hypothetical protein
MEKSSTADCSLSLAFANDYTNLKIEKQSKNVLKPAARSTEPAGRPTEETINHLNRIGKDYPFCIYYKHKMYDPL